MRFLVTGSAGFIGYHLCARLLAEGHEVIGLDGFTPYYDLALKEARQARLSGSNRFVAHRLLLEDAAALGALFAQDGPFDIVVHLGAQAGVRYSLENPRAYVDSNLTGTFNLMEMVRRHPVRHFLLASTSSAYGANTAMPFRETDRSDHPLTLYAASKKANEAMSHSYAHLFAIPTTCFRFFTVYGPWGRPDMAPWKFTQGILEGRPIDVYNHGDMARDFTFIDDLIESIIRLVDCVPVRPASGEAIAGGDSLSPAAPWRLVNIGAGRPERLMDFIAAIEHAAGRKAVCNFLPIQPGDVPASFASADLLERLTGYRPATQIGPGMKAFVDWFRAYHGV
jgi:UDP-glucuronate 4-epimerase